MSLTIKWAVEKVKVAENNLIVKVDLMVTATDVANNLTASAAYSCDLVRGDTFTEYSQVTEQQVFDWCFAPKLVTWLDEDNVEQSKTVYLKDDGEDQVTGQINRRLAEIASQPPLPWVAQPA
jgi:hypothetical protein